MANVTGNVEGPEPGQLIDWKKRYDELSKVDWDTKKQVTGLSRLGERYHPLEPFFKFDSFSHEADDYSHQWYVYVCGGVAGACNILVNTINRKPIWSGLPKYAFVIFSGALFGHLVYKNQRRRAMERDLVCVHYMLLHEDRFPIVERKKFKDVVRDWQTTRTV